MAAQKMLRWNEGSGMETFNGRGTNVNRIFPEDGTVRSQNHSTIGENLE
jgi:hypothetical protein